MSKTCLVTGDRNWSNQPMTAQVMTILAGMGYTRVVHGDARGADSLAAACARLIGMEVKAYPADWDTYHRAAGPIRNQQMLDEEPAIDLCVALHDHLDESKGTLDMIRRAQAAGKQILHWSSDGLQLGCWHGVPWCWSCDQCKRWSPGTKPRRR